MNNNEKELNGIESQNDHIEDNTNDQNTGNNDKNEIETLKNSIKDLEDRLLRSLAESQNIQKRAEKEKDDILKYCISSFAKDILSIRDNLKLALKNFNPENVESIVDGIKLTLSDMDKTLGNHGILEIESKNKPFDPNLHQAILEIPTDDKDSGIVMEVIQDGFTIKGRLLRPSLVGVSKKN